MISPSPLEKETNSHRIKRRKEIVVTILMILVSLSFIIGITYVIKTSGIAKTSDVICKEKGFETSWYENETLFCFNLINKTEFVRIGINDWKIK